MSISGKNLQRVVQAKNDHDARCPFGGVGIEVHMNHFDIERCGWEEGDIIAGLTVVCNPKIATGRLEIRCDAELTGGGRETAQEEVIDAVADQRELVPAGA